MVGGPRRRASQQAEACELTRSISCALEGQGGRRPRATSEPRHRWASCRCSRTRKPRALLAGPRSGKSAVGARVATVHCVSTSYQGAVHGPGVLAHRRGHYDYSCNLCRELTPVNRRNLARMPPVVRTEDLIDAVAIAELLGLAHRNTVSVYQKRYPEMPRPVVDLGPGRSRLWLRQEVIGWARSARRIE